MKLLMVCCLVAVSAAAPQQYYQGNYQDNYQGRYQQQYQPQVYSNKPVVPIVSANNEINPDGSFSYSYATGDGQQAQAQGYLKNSGIKDQETQIIQGSYSYTSPDGTPITVNYIADENGYRAEGAHLPTPPPIPEAIQRSLDLIARTQNTQYQEPQYQHQYQQPQYQQPQYQPHFQPQPQYRPYKQAYRPF